MKVEIGVVTETWLADGHGLDDDVDDLLLGAGLGMLYRNREANSRGVAHGGVAIFYKESSMSMKAVKLHNPGKYEVVMGVATVKGYSRKLVVVACYLPPNYTFTRARKAMDFIAGCVTRAKRQYDDPFLVVTGDFNQWKVEEVLADFADMDESDVGPTRSGRCIDRVFTNFSAAVDKCGTVPPLETDDQTSKKSDHAIAYVRADLPRVAEVKWLDYEYRYFNEDSSKLFGGWLACQDWNDLRLSLIHI